MDLIYIPTAPIYLTVQEKSRNLTTALTSSSNKGKGISCIWMGRPVLLDTPTPGITAIPNDHNIKSISQLRVGDRIKAEGLIAVRCGIENDKRGKPQAAMWLTFKIRDDWTFLGNPTVNNESSDGGEKSDDDGDSDGIDSRSTGSTAEESSDDDESSGNSDGDYAKGFNTKRIAGKKPTSKIGTAKSYSYPVRRSKDEVEAKTGDKRVFFDDKSDRTEVNRGSKDRKRAREPQSTIVHRKRARSRISVNSSNAVSVSFRADVFDYLAKDKELQQKKMDSGKSSSTVPNSTKGKIKERLNDKDELGDSENPLDNDENVNEDSSQSDEDDAPPKQTKPAAVAIATPTVKTTTAPVSPPSSGVDTNATAKVETGKTKTTTTIVTNTVLTTATMPSVHAMTAAAAMAMSASVTKAMAIVRKHQKKMAPSTSKK